MNRRQEGIIRELVGTWVPLALEYAEGADNVTTLFIYAGSELGSYYANAFFEQEGQVNYPGKLQGADTSRTRVLGMQRGFREALHKAEAQFTEAEIPCPTEYRVSYEPGPGHLDVQLSRELKYAHHPVKTLEHGPEDWLDGRLPKTFGRLIPPEAEWPAPGTETCE
jgi:hypothetical protein